MTERRLSTIKPLVPEARKLRENQITAGVVASAEAIVAHSETQNLRFDFASQLTRRKEIQTKPNQTIAILAQNGNIYAQREMEKKRKEHVGKHRASEEQQVIAITTEPDVNTDPGFIRGSIQNVIINQDFLGNPDVALLEWSKAEKERQNVLTQYTIMESAFAGYALQIKNQYPGINFMNIFHQLVLERKPTKELQNNFESLPTKKPESITNEQIRDARYIGARLVQLHATPLDSMNLIEHIASNPQNLQVMKTICKSAQTIEDIKNGIQTVSQSLSQPTSL